MSTKNPNAKLLKLAKHVLAMQDDAYLTGHPEWEHIVIDAYRALGKPLTPSLLQTWITEKLSKKRSTSRVIKLLNMEKA